MFYRFLICSFFIIGSLSLSVDTESSGEESKCECPARDDHSTTSTTVVPDEDFCRKYCNAHKPVKTTVKPVKTTVKTTVKPVTTTVATTTVSMTNNRIVYHCCGCCNEFSCCNEVQEATTTTTTTSSTTATQASKKPCCCCRGSGTNCRRPHGTAMIFGVCPKGWIRFGQSCYFMESKKMSLMEAQKSCVEKGSTLFVADSIEEFNKVMKETTPYYWSWIGLGQIEMNSVPKWGIVEPSNPSTFRCLPLDNSKLPSWGGYGGVDPSRLKWLINPFSPISNGWSPVTTCVGYYNGDMYSNYVYFYPCSSQFYSVCERNSTLM